MYRKFKPLNIPDGWEQYWSKYPNGYTIMEALIDWVSQVDDMVTNQNELTDKVKSFGERIDEFINQFGAELQKEVQALLTEWQASGQLDVVISEALQWQLDDYIATNEQDKLSITAQLQHIHLENPISPEDFEGTDFQKVQQALDLAVETNRALRLSRMYDITGQGTLMINKEPDTLNRRVLYIVGAGGGIEKHDMGFVFDTPEPDTGDIDISGVRFVSTEGAKTKVWNCDNIIRFNSHHNEYYEVDTVAEALNRYYQSVRFTNEHIVKGAGTAFYFKGSYDTTISDNLIEYTLNGVVNVPLPNGVIENRNLRIENNVIEGLKGVGVQLGSSLATVIKGNYFETNRLGDIDLATINNHFHFGLSVEGNMVSVHRDRKEQGGIKVKNLHMAATTGNVKNEEYYIQHGSNTFSGNAGVGSRLYDMSGTGVLISVGDREDIKSTDTLNIIKLDGVTKVPTNNALKHNDITTSGIVRRFQVVAEFSILKSQTRSFDLPVRSDWFQHPIKNEDMVQVYPLDGEASSDYLNILSFRPVHSTPNVGNLRIKATNTDTLNDHTFKVLINIWKLIG